MKVQFNNLENKFFTYQNIIIFASIIPIVIFGFLTYNSSKQTTIKTTFEYIKNINKQKKQLVVKYFDNLEFDINELSTTVTFLQKQATNNIINIQSLQKTSIQNYYNLIENELVGLSKKDIFQYIFNFKNRKKDVKAKYLKNIYSYKKEMGLKNILMINNVGKIIYSSDEKELLGTNVKQLSEEFSNIWNEIKILKYNGKKNLRFVNFGYEKISKSYKQYAIIHFKDVDGFIAMEIDQEVIAKIIQDTGSLGDTAETYLTFKYKNKTYLASNRIKKHGKVGDEKNNRFVDIGFKETGADIKYGSLGDIELVGYMPIKIKNIILSMQTTVSYKEVISPIIKGSDYFEQFTKEHDYHKIMLVGPKGDIFYTVVDEDDYQTNLLTGKYSHTHLAQAVRKVFKEKKFVLTDIDFYEPCSDKVAQFALYPIIKKDGSIQSIIVVQIKMNALSKIITKDSDLYITKETYIVAKDKMLRTNSFLEVDKYNMLNSLTNNILIDTLATRKVFISGESASILKDYRDTYVLSSFSPLTYQDLKWAVITEVDKKEIEERIFDLKINILIFVFISSIVALVVMIFLTNEKKKQDKKLRHIANHDSLTGLPNRKFALDFLTYSLANVKRLRNKGAILFIDLDRFKIINDSFGHDVGDIVLKEVSLRLKKLLREEDLIARLGGDEFIIIVNNFNLISDIDKLCKRIIKTISKPIKYKERHYQIGLSIGISIFPDDSMKAEELLQFSDTAMFKTKDNGRNGYTYYNKKMTEQSLLISRVEDELKYAIENNELVLYYQPQVDLKTNKVVGVESLVRWNHPRDGLVMPSSFIEIAEDSDLIIDLGYWVTKTACEAFKEFKKNGVDLNYISINMSIKQLQCVSCIEQIKTLLDDLEFNPKWLELEITENTLVSNIESTLANIAKFKDLGVKFAIDDFGTGYSSFSYLKSLNISTLKIDREFVKDIIEDEDDKNIVDAIISMGHILNYKLIAEGAETKAEVELLNELDCDLIQGYYYSKPLPEKELLKYIKDFNKSDKNDK